jgi:hypothetical protein
MINIFKNRISFYEQQNKLLAKNGLQLFLYKKESGVAKLLLNDKVLITVSCKKKGKAQVISMTNLLILLKQLNSLDVDYLKQICFVGLIPQISKKNKIVKTKQTKQKKY